MFSDHHPRTLLMAAKASSGDWSTEMVVVKFGSGLFMAVPFLCENVWLNFSFAHPRTLLMAAKASSGDWSTEMVVVKFGSGLFMAVPFLCENVWLTFSCADQLAQIAVDEHAPGVGAATVAFNLRFEA